MLTPDQLDRIPDELLIPDRRLGAVRLIHWLRARGWQMTLWQLDSERRRRQATGSLDRPKEQRR